MKKLLLFLVICLAFSCKKRETELDITNYSWMLESATVSPAVMVNGKEETDYLKLKENAGCITTSYTVNFFKDRKYSVYPGNPACDYFNFPNAKWFKEGNTIRVAAGNVTYQHIPDVFYSLSGNKMTNTFNFVSITDNLPHQVTYILIAKNK